MNRAAADTRIPRTRAGRAIVRVVPMIIGAVWLLAAVSDAAIAQRRDNSGKAWDPTLTLGDQQMNAGRTLSREQLIWCIEQAETIKSFKERLQKRKVSIEQVKRWVTAQREAAKRSEVGPGETNSADGEGDQDALNTATDGLDAMETYDIACAGRPFLPRIEAAVLKELRLRENPMRSIPYPATGPAPVADDHLTTGRPPLSDAEKAEVTKYHNYLIRSITAGLNSDAPALASGGVRVKMRIAPSGSLISRDIALSSGDRVLDAAVLAAVDRAGPFDPPPYVIAYSPSDIVATITFAGGSRD